MAMFNSFIDTVSDKVGNLNDLLTGDKSSCVGSINELYGGITGVDYLNHINLTFNASNMQDYLRQVIDHTFDNFSVGYTVNMFGIWSGVCTFSLQVSRTSTNQTIVSAIPQPGNASITKMWIGMKENNTYTYSTIDMTVVS